MPMAKSEKQSLLVRILLALCCAALTAFSIWSLIPEPLLWTYVGGGVGFVVGYLWGDDGISMIASLF